MHAYLWIALGGALGGLARYGLSGAVARRIGETFPWGTLAVNATGALLIGVLWALAGDTGVWRFIAFGVLGSYTTVSSFSLQTLALARDGRRAAALGNVAASLILCLAAVSAGAVLALRLGAGG